jgi:hypothetical protein
VLLTATVTPARCDSAVAEVVASLLNDVAADTFTNPQRMASSASSSTDYSEAAEGLAGELDHDLLLTHATIVAESLTKFKVESREKPKK